MFLAYGCEVDEFQHIMYQNPDLTPDERNASSSSWKRSTARGLISTTCPSMAGAQVAAPLHIYECPFYYIDYCLSTMAALQFFLLSLPTTRTHWGATCAWCAAPYGQLHRAAGVSPG